MAKQARQTTWSGPVPKCAVRIGEPCTLCQPGSHGPEDCGLVYLVMNDPELRERLGEIRAEAKAASAS
ncbi:DUF6767 domain-containing protein [Nocardioides ferulae]|uniref:DUF6767 domain-containing protein n=1 Tax=Nocardioides ferulae TaxID=2340821 RepID=UPI000EB2712F|nr:DUF6767 domain-containing protein [Nocardioides ferulae]